MFSDCRHLIGCNSAASTPSLKASCEKLLYQMPRFRFIRNSEQCQLLTLVPALLLYELSNKHLPSFPMQWKSSQLSWPLWPVLCPSFALRWCYCKVQSNVPHESCRLWCTLRKEEVKKGWLLFLCAESQVGSQTSILLTFKAALKAMCDQAITLTNSAFST